MSSESCTALDVVVARGEELGRYGFGDGHPFGSDRQAIFWRGLRQRHLADRVETSPPVKATHDDIASFHSPRFIDEVIDRSAEGVGFLDLGDTPAFPGVYDAAAWVVGTTLDGARQLMTGEARRVFVPVAGLHHARRDRAGGFCVFNDCGVVIEVLRSVYGLHRIGYVDIDAHHGDGVFYGFENDPDVVISDIHQDGRTLYPGTGGAHETGRGEAEGTKLNIPLLPGAADEAFLHHWERMAAHIDAAAPEFVIFQCGADGLAGDPLANLEYTAAAHRQAAADLCRIADRHCDGRLLALGGGGYDPTGMADAWGTVVEVMLES